MKNKIAALVAAAAVTVPMSLSAAPAAHAVAPMEAIDVYSTLARCQEVGRAMVKSREISAYQCKAGTLYFEKNPAHGVKGFVLWAR